MQIKKYHQPGFKAALVFLKNIKIMAVVLALFIYSAGLVLFSGTLYKEGFFGEVLRPLVLENVRIPGNYVKGLLSDPEHLTIDIKHTNYQKLAYKREVALDEGVLHPFREDFVPAKVRWRGETIKVSMRLKGDLGDHWTRDFKWSFRIKTKGNKTIMGMKNFSIQHPRTRGFLVDWHLHKMLERHGFITLRFDFIDVTINGKHLGVYNIEEHFEQQLLTNNNRINGPIIRIKDHLLWYRLEPDGTGFSKDTIDELYTSSPIDAFTTSTINSDPKMLGSFIKAKNLLELFRRGELLTHQVFDVEKLSRLFAILDLFGYRHTSAYSNIRFYFNPVTSLLVPIGYDNTFIKSASSVEGQGKFLKLDESYKQDKLDWKATFFADKVFFEKYLSVLQEISEQRYLDGFFEEIRDDYDAKMSVIYRSFPGYNFTPIKNILYDNQKFIRKTLNPLEGIQAYVKNVNEKKEILTLEIGNIQFLPVEILNISYKNQIFSPLNEIRIMQTKKPFEVMEFSRFEFDVPIEYLSSNDFKDNLKVNYRLFGAKDIKSIAAFPWSYLDSDFIDTDFIRHKPNFDKFEFIEVFNAEKIIAVKQGTWELDEDLIIPNGYTFVVNKGTSLNFVNSAKILSYSPIYMVGTKSEPVIIKSSDATGQGIVVIKSKNKSVLDNATFDNLDSPSQGTWTLSAAVTFYESDVEIINSHFSNSRAVAGLGIIRSKYFIDKTRFTNSGLDSLRLEFSKGSIQKSEFSSVGESAIYASGSILEGSKLRFDGVSSIAINADDESQLSFNNLEIKDAKAAVISQSLSKVNIDNIEIDNADYGFVLFNRKPEFGPGSINANSVNTNNVTNKSLVEENSVLVVNQVMENNFHDDFSMFHWPAVNSLN